jgi:hypothetical protein
MLQRGRTTKNQEAQRLTEASQRTAHWRRWEPYLSERQWGTLREDYSLSGTPGLEFFPHDRSRAYRWGEDGLAGIPVAKPVVPQHARRHAPGFGGFAVEQAVLSL